MLNQHTAMIQNKASLVSYFFKQPSSYSCWGLLQPKLTGSTCIINLDLRGGASTSS